MEFEFEDFSTLEDEKKPINKGNQFDNKLVRISSALSRQIRFDISDEKLFAMAVSQLDFYDKNSDFWVEIRVKDVQEKLGLAEDEAFYTNLRKQYKNLMKKTYIQYDIGNEYDDFCDGFLISTVRTQRKTGNIKIQFNKSFDFALQWYNVAFTKIPLDDILSYKTKYAPILQRYLTSMYKVGKEYAQIQHFDFTTKQLKDMFGLTEDDYCYKKGKNKGKFDRPNFEKKTLIAAIDEINSKSCCMRLSWEKERARGVIYYRISCMIATKIKPDYIENEPEPTVY